MAITVAPQNERDRTNREAIDAALLRASDYARGNNLELLRIRALLFGAPAEEQPPERPARPGWLGEMQDALEMMNDVLEQTAQALRDISQRVATQTPTVIPPKR